MPPKAARGRGAARARGATREQTTTTQGDATSDASPQSTEQAAASEGAANSDVPKQEDNTDVKMVSAAKEGSAHGEGDAADSSSRPAVQRIGSLQGSVPPSRSASPAGRGRGSTTRGKRGMVKPTFTGRRTKEERDALAKELKEREALRNAERDAANKKKDREAGLRKKRDENRLQRARGGYSGAVSGPFSLGSSVQDKKHNASRGSSGFGSGSGSRAVRIKNEGDSYGGGSGSYSGGGGGRPSVKGDHGECVSSEEEDDAEFPRRDIDLIEVSSDENEDKDTALQSKHVARTTLPVRIGRKEHQERTVVLNTDESSETAGKMLDKAESTGEASARTDSASASRKGKKVKDMEITGTRKPFRGVWQDSDDSETPIKVETLSDDEDMADAVQSGLSEKPPQAAQKQEPGSPDVARKTRARPQCIAEPVLQTDEDRAEWARYQSNMQSIRAELGPEEVPAVDANGDSPMTNGATEAKKPTVRDNNVYLFQIPPLMPELLPPSFKSEPIEEPASTVVAAPTAPTPSIKTEPDVKLEEGRFSDPSAKTDEAPQFASGIVGKLRVRQSGRTTLDWGGTCYEFRPGNKASFLQEVVSINVVPEVKRVVPEEAGDAVSMGRVKGKFVVVPDWSDMLG